MLLLRVSKSSHNILQWLLVILLSMYTPSTVSDFISYSKGTICNMDERVFKTCSKLFHKVRAPVECAELCNADEQCYGFTVKEINFICYIHYHCPVAIGCTKNDIEHPFMAKQHLCKNGGVYNPNTGLCSCVNSWVGSTCSRRPKHCGELKAYGYPEGLQEAVLDPKQDGKQPFIGICGVNSYTSWGVQIVLLHEGNINFNLTWDKYRAGFIHDLSNYWIGLENWHSISNILGYTKLFLVADFGEFGRLYRQYSSFVLHGESRNFSYSTKGSYDNGSGRILKWLMKMGDCFGPSKETPFSTWDVDNDNEENKNCAADGGSGGWYSGCDTNCNLFGWGWKYKDAKHENQLINIPGLDFNGLPQMTFLTVYIIPP